MIENRPTRDSPQEINMGKQFAERIGKTPGDAEWIARSPEKVAPMRDALERLWLDWQRKAQKRELRDLAELRRMREQIRRLDSDLRAAYTHIDWLEE